MTIEPQILYLNDTLFPALMADKKTYTIRMGHRDIEPGFLMYQGVTNPSLQAYVWVKQVLHLKLKGASVKLKKPVDDLIKSLQIHYPAQVINEETQVTLIIHLTVSATQKIFPQKE